MKKAFFLILIFSALIPACVSKQKETVQPILNQSVEYFAAGDLQMAIDSYDRAIKKYPDDPKIQKSYLESLEAIRQQGDKAFQAKDFVGAQRIYSLLKKNFPRFKSIEDSLSFTAQSLSRWIRDCQFELCQSQARQALKDGDVQKAFDVAKACSQSHPDDKEFAASLVRIAEEIRGAADKALAREDFVAAGKLYHSLWKGFSPSEKSATPPAFARGSLEEGIKKCRMELTKRGLEQYRQGKLAEAISTWEGLLSFDPDNVEIKKAVETAREQLKKLKKN